MFWRTPTRIRGPLSQQRGSIIVPAAAAIFVALILFGAAQIGQYYYLKRELQNAADLAALAGADALQIHQTTIVCPPAQEQAKHAIDIHSSSLLTSLNNEAIALHCGVWQQEQAHFRPTGSINRDASEVAAVQVILRHQATPVFPFMPVATIQATATAASSKPVAVFSVGSQFLSLQQNGLVFHLLKTLGLQPNQLALLNSAGVAQLSLTPAGLLDALGLPLSLLTGVGSPEAVLALEQLTLSEILHASIELLSREQTAQVEALALIEYLRLLLQLDTVALPVKLFGEGGILALLDSTDPLSALHAKVGVLDLVNTGLLLANGENLINLDVDTGSAASLLGNAATIKARLIEPPSVGIGGIGASANSAAVRLYVRLNTSESVLGKLLLKPLNTQIDLPLILELTQAQARVKNMCAAPLTDKEVDFEVSTALLNVCMGEFPDSDFFSVSNSCVHSTIDKKKIIDILGLVSLRSKLQLPIPAPKTNANHEELWTSALLQAPPSDSSEALITNHNLNLNQTAELIIDAILADLLGDLTGHFPRAALSTEQKKQELATGLVGYSGAGRSISEVVGEVTWSQERLRAMESNISNNGLVGFLGTTLNFVGAVGTSLGAALSDTLCLPAIVGGPNPLRECRVGVVKGLVLNENGLLGATLGIVVSILDPILLVLDQILESLLRSLGVGINEAKLKLHDVQCGTAYLVQ